MLFEKNRPHPRSLERTNSDVESESDSSSSSKRGPYCNSDNQSTNQMKLKISGVCSKQRYRVPANPHFALVQSTLVYIHLSSTNTTYSDKNQRSLRSMFATTKSPKRQPSRAGSFDAHSLICTHACKNGGLTRFFIKTQQGANFVSTLRYLTVPYHTLPYLLLRRAMHSFLPS